MKYLWGGRGEGDMERCLWYVGRDGGGRCFWVGEEREIGRCVSGRKGGRWEVGGVCGAGEEREMYLW